MRKDIENSASGITRITKHGDVQCIAGHNMVFLSKDYNMDSYISGCPVLDENRNFPGKEYSNQAMIFLKNLG